MAAYDNSQGYQCEFIDSVPDGLHCKKCSLVARRLSFTSCCEETFCYACIDNIRQQAKPCPECGQQSFTILELFQHHKLIEGLQVYCSMKGRGCDWSGTLEQLQVHLDPDQGNCQHMDTKCPLNCQIMIPKNKVEQHVAEECVERDYVYKHCGFKVTYKQVMGTHLAQRTIQDQEQKLQEWEQKLQEYKQKCKEQDHKLLEYEQNSKEQQRKCKMLEHKFFLLQKIYLENETAVVAAQPFTIKQKLKMNSFSRVKAGGGNWMSPGMYTSYTSHNGYKFCIGAHFTEGASSVDIWVMPGDHDSFLKWPTKATFTIELVNHQGGDNWRDTTTVYWDKPCTYEQPVSTPIQFLNVYLNEDCLHFNVTVVCFSNM